MHRLNATRIMKTSLLAIVVCSIAMHTSTAAELVMTEGGSSRYQIVVATDAAEPTRHAAEELQLFVKQMTGAELPIVTDDQPLATTEIIVGSNRHLKQVHGTLDFKTLGKEGYVIRTVGDTLVIAGGEPRGTLYGVYGFLEDICGCRWFTPEVSHIPQFDRLSFDPIDDRKVPVFEYREPFLAECFDGDWCARNRMNSSHGALESKHGGKVAFADAFFCHTFETLVPPNEYFEPHPEYFALVRGERQRAQMDIAAQLCCTNPDVVRICTERIRAAMRDNPDAFAFSVSQNDSYQPSAENPRYEPGWCECEKCQALAQSENSQMAPVLQLVNQVAEAVEKEFPDKVVETLAYHWTRHPPQNMRPRHNVVIRLCSIESCFSHPLAICDSETSTEFRTDLEAWGKLTDRIWIWDYATNFGHYLLPHPNQFARAANLRYFADHNVKGVFVEDCHISPHSELAALGGYVTAKCLRNPDYDADVAINEFLNAYYGNAADPIRSYLDLIHEKARRENVHVVGIDISPANPHLDDDLLQQADKLWGQAERSVAAEPDLLHRVQCSRLSVDYAILERARLQALGQILESEPLKRLALARYAPYVEALNKSGVTFPEVPLDDQQYPRELAKALGIDPD